MNSNNEKTKFNIESIHLFDVNSKLFPYIRSLVKHNEDNVCLIYIYHESFTDLEKKVFKGLNQQVFLPILCIRMFRSVFFQKKRVNKYSIQFQMN